MMINDGIKSISNNNSINATAFRSTLLTMSRPQGHRKSQSTSALNVLASQSTSIHTSTLHISTATPRSRRTQGSTRLGSVVEDDSERDERSHSHSRSHSRLTTQLNEDNKEGLEGLLGMISSRTPRKEKHVERAMSSDALGMEELRSAVGDVSVSIHHLCHRIRNLTLRYVLCDHQNEDDWRHYATSNGYSSHPAQGYQELHCLHS